MATVIIPARYESSRFPGKVLADRTGKPLIRHVHERALLATRVERVIVATDDERIREAVESFGGEVVMTRRDHPNGTSRIAEAAATLDAEIIVNIQGDEPEIDPTLIDLAVDAIEANPDCPVGTVATPFGPDEDAHDPNLVKVVRDRAGCALYFSRSLIPHLRPEGRAPEHPPLPLRHLGVYVYRREFLAIYAGLAPTPLEQAERLEQLRVLEHGYRMVVAVGTTAHQGIDTPAQYEAFVRRHARG